MRIFYRFLHDQLLFSIIYICSFGVIIGFYQMVTSRVEWLYPTMIALFFYLLYMGIRFVYYIVHDRKMQKLKTSPMNAVSSIAEYQECYDMANDIYQIYNANITHVKQEQMNNRRFQSASIHTMKTPVTVMSLLLQRRKSGEISEEEMQQGMEQEMERLLLQLNQMLELGRLEEYERDYDPRPVDLAQEVRTAVNASKNMFIHSHVFPKVEIGEFNVLTDEKWNGVLLQQIISNAIKYSAGDDNKYVYFTAEQDDKYTKLYIRDEGIGIPKEDLPKVFEPYFTGANGRQGYRSSGIGLYLCKQICDRLGQKIQIENKDGCLVTITYLTKL